MTYTRGESEVVQSCLTLCDPVVYSLPGSFIHGIFQARILEWVAISFSRASSRPKRGSNLSLLYCRQTVKTSRANRISLVAQTVKNLPAMPETGVRSLGGEDALEKEMATHSSILAWRTP